MRHYIHNELLVIITNYACTLKCKDCANFIYQIPPEINKQFVEPGQLKEDLDKLSTVLRTNRIQIQGGEATLHKELDKIIDIVKASGISENIQLVTNASQPLDNDLVAALKRNNANVRISNYEAKKQNIFQWESVLRFNSIDYSLYKYAGGDNLWYDLGRYKMSRNVNDADVRKIFASCPFKVCWTIYDGQLTKCSRSSSGYLSGHHGFFHEDFVDIRQGHPYALWDDLNRLLQNNFMESCRYCNGVSGKRIMPGIQFGHKDGCLSSVNNKIKAAFYYSLSFQLRVLEPIAGEFEETLMSNNMNEIEKWEPQVIFTADSAQIPALRKIFDADGPTLIGLRHGVANKYIPPEKEYALADYVCGSNWDKREFDESGVSPRSGFLITGNPWIDGVFRVPKRKLNKENPTILFAPTYNPEVSAAVFFKSDLVRLIREVYPQSTIIIKPHPAIIDNDHHYVTMHQMLFKELIANWEHNAQNDKNVVFIRDSKAPISDFYSETDILISDGSSLVFEFMALNRPILLYSSDKRIGIWKDMYDEKALANSRRNVGTEFRTKDEFIQALKNVFSLHHDIHRKYQAAYSAEIFENFTDGLSYKRVAEKIKQIKID